MDRNLVRRARALFAERFGGVGRAFFAGGRVNLLGAHIDYHGGCVLPVAVDRGVVVVARARADGRLRLASCNLPATFDLALESRPAVADVGWGAYPLGVVVELERAGRRVGGFDLAFAGDLPVGAGLSSSAAILVATATAIAALSGIELPPIEAARLAHRAETGFVGVQCGIMDPFASALGRIGHALWLDCKDQSFDYVPLPSDRLAFVMLDSMTRRELKGGGYNRCVAESKEALATLRVRRPGLACLRDLSPAELEAARSELGEREWKRARHVVTEVARVRRARELLATGALLEFGQLLWLSHLSSRHHYEVSTPRLDALQELALGQPDCWGARLTGAGFGGCALALVHPAAVEPFCVAVADGFEQRFGQRPDVHPLRPGGPPHEVVDA